MIPPDMSEQQVIQTINNIANRLALKFKFGYHALEDMKQQARLFAWEGLENYDGIRPLENFLWTHVRNRLYNFKRNNYGRPDKPCDACPFFNINFQNSRGYGCEAFDDHDECLLYTGRLNRNTAKKNIMNAVRLDLELQGKASSEESVDKKHIFSLIDNNLPVQYREDWIRLTNDLKLSKSRKETIVQVVLSILKENGIDPEAW